MVTENCNVCKSCPVKWDNFCNLTEDQIRYINENRFEASFKAGETIFKQGSPTSNILFLSQGLAKIYMEGYDMKRIILSIAQPAMLISGPGFFVDKRHHFSLAALTDLSVCFVDTAVVKEMMVNNKKFCEGFLTDISKSSLFTYNKLVSLTQKKMHGRLAEGLVYLSEEVFKDLSFKCILSRQELGELTGMTKESVVRILKEFNDEDILNVESSMIEITDINRLKNIMMNG